MTVAEVVVVLALGFGLGVVEVVVCAGLARKMMAVFFVAAGSGVAFAVVFVFVGVFEVAVV